MSASVDRSAFLDSPFRSFFLIWTPALFSMIAEPLTGIIDTAFVAQLGAEALAALGVGTVVLTSGLWLFNFLSVGSQTEVAQASGEGKPERGKRFGSLAVSLALVIGLVMTIIAVSQAPLITSLMGAEGLVQEYAVQYVEIRAFGGPAVLITLACFGILYGLADMRSPLQVAIGVNVLNILLDWMMIFGKGPFPEMGIAGAALASAISQWVGALWCLLKVRRQLGFTREIAGTDFVKLMKIGRDMFLRTGSLLLFLLLATRSATRISADAGGAHQAIRQVWIFSALFLDASAVTAQSVIGHFFGSGDIAKARKVATMVCRISLLIGFGLLAILLATTSLFGALLVPASSLVIFAPAWTVSALMQPLAALAFVTDGIHWGTGDFAYLRNVVIVATLVSASGIALLDATNTASLTAIWWITGGWVAIRAGFGVARLWPGSPKAPLGK